jgi:hypothetical protein
MPSNSPSRRDMLKGAVALAAAASATDPRAVKLYGRFERAVYETLKVV